MSAHSVTQSIRAGGRVDAPRLALVNMPFGSLNRPPIGLTQLRAVAEARLGSQIQVSLLHFNLEYGKRIGAEIYQEICHDFFSCSLGEWLFREIAHPQLTPNDGDYFGRYFPHSAPPDRQLIADLKAKVARISEELIESYRLDSYDLIGFTAMFAQTNPSIAIARLVKERNPEVTTLMGGATCEGSPGGVLARSISALDFTFSGPGMVSFPLFLEHWLRDRNRIPHIPGVNQAHGTSGQSAARPDPATIVGSHTPVTIRTTPPPSGGLRPAVERGADQAIEEYPELDYDDYFDAVDRLFPGESAVKPAVLFETARGCWWGERSQCTFCGLNGESMAFRAMSPGRAVHTIQSLFDRYATRTRAGFQSVDNIMPKEYLTEVLPLLRPPPSSFLFCEIKANLSDDDVATLAKAQVTAIQPGVEALSTDVLRLMRKGSNAFTNVRLLKSCRRHGVDPIWYILIGFPGEDESVYPAYQAVIPQLFHLPPPGAVFPVRFERFSAYFEDPEGFGLSLEPAEMYRHTLPFSGMDLREFAYWFEDVTADAAYAKNTAKWRGPLNDLIDEWRKRWAHPAVPPRLELDCAASGVEAKVVDTRGSEPLTYEVPRHVVRLLQELEVPLDRQRILGIGDQRDETEDALQWALTRGLIFAEGSHLLGLPVTALRSTGRGLIGHDQLG